MAFLYPRHFCDLPILWDDPEWVKLHGQEVLVLPGRNNAASADRSFSDLHSAYAQELRDKPFEPALPSTGQDAPLVVNFDIWTNGCLIDDVPVPTSDDLPDCSFVQNVLSR